MPFLAGFAQRDISPEPGALNMGHLVEVRCDHVRDPLHARAAVLGSGEQTIGFVALDTLSIRWTTVDSIRAEVSRRFGFPGENLMVAASHTHAGPAVARAGDVPRDDAYLALLVEQAVEAVGEALQAMQPAEAGFGRAFEFEVSRNRRVMMRDGTARCHGTFDDPEALCYEGPVDPEVAVLAVRALDGTPLGCMVNYACHPTHYGGGEGFSAGYPGHLADFMSEQGWPCTLFLNGACGNLHTANPELSGKVMPAAEAGRRLANDTLRAIGAMQDWSAELPVRSARRTLELSYREPTPEQIAGTSPGAQRFGSPETYDRRTPFVLERIASRGVQPAEVQVNAVGELCYAAIPAEYFCEFALGIKQECWPRAAMVVSCANGMVGYVPTPWALEHGGYEATFTESSRMAPQTGDQLADCAVELIREI